MTELSNHRGGESRKAFIDLIKKNSFKRFHSSKKKNVAATHFRLDTSSVMEK